MDEIQYGVAGGYRMAVLQRGDAWLWRLTTPDGPGAGGYAPDEASARRTAAFAAFTISALDRAGRRRF